MPQMSPIMWTTTLIMSTLLTYQIKSMIFFEKKEVNEKSKKKKMKKKEIKW
uniref:ATP synthase F0 subunit 8 n=1 Tax=Flata truncata TaxID=3081121 RepID=UPI002A81E1C7|nr:ATP synthase F0 subunit 8 [Flata truncata]WOW99051.1 ATP synthase F0 subunit 8 [Flata truncata]